MTPVTLADLSSSLEQLLAQQSATPAPVLSSRDHEIEGPVATIIVRPQQATDPKWHWAISQFVDPETETVLVRCRCGSTFAARWLDTFDALRPILDPGLADAACRSCEARARAQHARTKKPSNRREDQPT